ncbi:glutathione S-transferase N-terminal domain-containing protein [Halorarius halobius]|uniref:glutathione S-transferase N-terminal domain-containing protein n=1 Tax=Halorarius halobius TaxID=2962671 RepID=UPI0020CC3908|nr:glutathione S-transferase N-terminal domain-containing protein [Halorarius halobius]
MLELYQSEDCPYSEQVRRTLSELGVSYVVHNPRLPGSEGGDVTNESTHEELEAIGGEDQIPFLVDHATDERRYEADAIVAYLEDRYE